MEDVSSLFVSVDDSIRQVMAKIDRGALGIALLVDDEQRLLATVTDGDVRRTLLSGSSLDRPVAEVLVERRRTAGHSVLTADVDSTPEQRRRIMSDAGVRHLPLVSDNGRVVGLTTLSDVEDADEQLPVRAVIMAGGFGTRLRPFTDNVPKPMLPIAGRPLMERTIERLKKSGIHRINVTTHYMPEKITEYFGDGRRFGVDLNYVSEDQPLGTAGSLRLVEDVEEPLLVMNGDILTRVDFEELLKFHRETNAELTVAVRQYDVEVPYGVVDARGGIVTGLREKPKLDFLVNAGIYLVEPAALRQIPVNKRYDMTDLIERLLAGGAVVSCFPIVEYWLDIGQHDDFNQAQDDMREMRWAA